MALPMTMGSNPRFDLQDITFYNLRLNFSVDHAKICRTNIHKRRSMKNVRILKQN